MKLSTMWLSRIAAIAVAIVGWNYCSTAFGVAGNFMLDLEANGALPGGAGGKTVLITTAGEVVTLKIYGLFQGSSGGTANYAIRTSAGWLRSSTGGLLGNLSAAATGNYTAFGATPGTQNDIDGDGDLDIGGSFSGQSQFAGFVSTTADYGYGVANGQQDGTISGATANALNSAVSSGSEGMAWSLIGFVSFTPISPTAGQTTTVTMISNFNGTLPANGAQSGQDVGVGTGGSQATGRFNWNGSAGNNSQVLQGPGVVITVVPEPATLVLAGLGALGLGLVGLRRFRRA